MEEETDSSGLVYWPAVCMQFVTFDGMVLYPFLLWEEEVSPWDGSSEKSARSHFNKFI